MPGSLFAVLALAGLAHCGSPIVPAPPEDAGVDAAAETADSGPLDDVAADQADTAAPDAVDDAAEATAETAEEVTATVDAAVDVAECAAAADCTGKLSLSPCELAACALGVCKKVAKPDTCCLDSDCDDTKECTFDKCDQAKHTCGHAVVPNCCEGKVLLQNATFESGQDGFVATNGAENGKVGWQTTSYRAHGGKSALYFGNDCHSYDKSMTPSGACKPGITAAKDVVTTSLVSKTYPLPKGKKAQAHFWLWLDTEPPYTKSLPSGTCTPACNAFSSCIQVSKSDICEPEKDVMVVQVLAQDAPPAPVFWSTQIGKSTLGDPQNPSGWRHVALDLAAWQGKAIQLAWQFNTLTNLKNGYEGIYLDDIVVETICPNAGIVCAKGAPCDDDGITCTADVCTGYANAADQGVCFHDALAACCLGDADCSDGDACTVDTCKGNTCQSAPDASKPGCCTAKVLGSDDFDGSDLTGWAILDANSQDVRWRLHPKGGNPAGAGGGGGSLYFGNPQFSNYADPSLPEGLGPQGMACAAKVDLKAGTNFNLLHFDLKLDTEWSDVKPGQYKNPPVPGKPKFDWFSVQLVTGGKYATVWSSDEILGTTGGKWLSVTAALDAWAGKSVQICVRFDSGDDQLNNKAGAEVDNLSVEVACQKAACYWNSDCAALGCPSCQTPVCTSGACACQAIGGCP